MNMLLPLPSLGPVRWGWRPLRISRNTSAVRRARGRCRSRRRGARVGTRSHLLAVALHDRRRRQGSCSNPPAGRRRTDDHLPTGDELVDQYVAPLADHAAIRPHVRYDAKVVAVGRKDFDKVRTKGRDQQPFEVRLASAARPSTRARSSMPAAPGRGPIRPGPGASRRRVSATAADRIAYGIPDVLGRERDRYAGRRVLVVGSGHSAFNVVLELLTLAEAAPQTRDRLGDAARRPRRVCGAAVQPTRSRPEANWASAPGARSRAAAFA